MCDQFSLRDGERRQWERTGEEEEIIFKDKNSTVTFDKSDSVYDVLQKLYFFTFWKNLKDKLKGPLVLLDGG